MSNEPDPPVDGAVETDSPPEEEPSKTDSGDGDESDEVAEIVESAARNTDDSVEADTTDSQETDDTEPATEESLDREAELEKWERSLDERERGLEQMRDDLDERAEELDDRERDIRETRQDLQSKRADLNDWESELESRADGLDEREAAIESQEEQLAERAGELDDHEEILELYVDDRVSDSLDGRIDRIEKVVGDRITALEEDIEASIETEVTNAFDQQEDTGPIGVVGGVVLGLTGAALIAIGVVFAFAGDISQVPTLHADTAINTASAGLIVLTGLAASLAAAAGQV